MNKKFVLLSLAALAAVCSSPACADSESSSVAFLGEISHNDDRTPEVLDYVISQQKEGHLPGLVPVPPPKTAPAPVPAPRPKAATPVAPQPAAPPAQSEFWQWPMQGRIKEMFSEIGYTKGIGIYGKKGQKIAASKSGKVTYVGTLSSFGRLVIMQNDNDSHYVSTYANLENIQVKVGDHVRQGEIIATLDTDREHQPILYFAINYYGKPVDPLRYLPDQSMAPSLK